MGAYHQGGRGDTEQRILSIIKMDPGCDNRRIFDQLDYSDGWLNAILRRMTLENKIVRKGSKRRWAYYLPVHGGADGEKDMVH